MPIPQIVCSGDAYQVGHQHGSHATKQVKGSIQFYSGMFEKYTGTTWSQIEPIALDFGQTIKRKWPEYFLEMQGVADGANCSLSDVLTLNVRTEIAFGLMDPSRIVSDGCTSLGWTRAEVSRMGQNWDWMEEQKKNIIALEIKKLGMPVIKMMTEGGIIGKIGMNSEGLGVCLNAVRCRGIDVQKLPIHLALRMALESRTLQDAVQRLESIGTGGSGFLLLGQTSDAIGLELTSKTVVRLEKDSRGRIMHSNHLIMQHNEAEEWPEDDSFDRLERLSELTNNLAIQTGNCNEQDFFQIFDDHEGYPMSICRRQEGECLDGTLFNIVMNLSERSAKIVVGKPCKPEEMFEFHFDNQGKING